MRTFRVWRARMPRISGLAPKSELIPAWCSMATTLSPRSSHSRNSSRTSSNRSAAIFGSQYRLGRLARTRVGASSTSWGTNGYGTSHCTRRPWRLLLGLSPQRQERDDAVDEGLGLLDLGMVPGPSISSKRAPGISARRRARRPA